MTAIVFLVTGRDWFITGDTFVVGEIIGILDNDGFGVSDENDGDTLDDACFVDIEEKEGLCDILDEVGFGDMLLDAFTVKLSDNLEDFSAVVLAISVDLTGSYFITSTATAGIEVSLATLFSGTS